MQKKEDLRVMKTKMAIKQAFFRLLKEKPFDKISVSDITSASLINRGTFYLHYKDKFDLIDQIENELLEKIDDALSMVTEEAILAAYTTGQPLPHIVPMLTYVEENAQFFVLISQRHGSHQLFTKVGDKYFYRFLRTLHVNRDEIWDAYLMEIMISNISAMLNTWISRGMKEKKEDLAQFLTDLVLTILGSHSNIQK